ncbi:MAG: DNA repair protein RecO [Oscillospiraceae bacterium]|nr:DNA repair protein RecO [Oscillospiraceae bacterium]
MLLTVKGIVIGQRNVGENSRFLDVLTEELGVIEVTAHAVKKINSKNAGSTALFTYSKFCLNKSKNRYSINSAEPIYSFHKLSADFEKLSLAAYFAELTRYTSASEQKAGGLLRFFAISLYELEKAQAASRLVKCVFELRLAVILGLAPDLVACADCAAYEHADFYFLIAEGQVFCGDCFADVNTVKAGCFLLNPALLRALRFVIFSQVEKVYKLDCAVFGANGEKGEKSLHELGIIGEEYLLYHLGRKFRTLEYYKKLCNTL